MTKDPEKRRATARRYRARKRIEKYGLACAAVDMRGRHGYHCCGPKHPRWNTDKRRLTSHGYVVVRVPVDHPHAWGPSTLRRFRYAYEHVVVAMETLGRPLGTDERVHHINRDKTDNRPDNLQIVSNAEHARLHAVERGRDRFGRFPPAAPPDSLRVREYPTDTAAPSRR